MKKTLLIAIFSLLMFSFSNKAEAIPVFYSFGGEKINTVTDLPNDSTTMVENGHYANIGCIYKQFSIFWVPIWNWDERYCVSFEGLDDTYGTILTKENAEEIVAGYGIKLGGASPSFWNKIGGKLIILIALGLIIWGYVGKKDDKATPTDDNNA